MLLRYATWLIGEVSFTWPTCWNFFFPSHAAVFKGAVTWKTPINVRVTWMSSTPPQGLVIGLCRCNSRSNLDGCKWKNQWQIQTPRVRGKWISHCEGSAAEICGSLKDSCRIRESCIALQVFPFTFHDVLVSIFVCCLLWFCLVSCKSEICNDHWKSTILSINANINRSTCLFWFNHPQWCAIYFGPMTPPMFELKSDIDGHTTICQIYM